jgi:glycosyltransferase involved in cell wall biosynthesis
VIAVVDEMKERLSAKGIPPDKITVVENTVDVDYLLSLQIDSRVVDQFGGDFVICFTGRFSWDRGLDIAIAAMPRILRALPEAKLLLVGEGGILPQVRSLVKAAGVEDKVVFAGWQPFDRLASYIAASDVCVVPYTASEQTDASSPNKLFLYMLMGKPVVVSSCRSLRRVVEGAGAGLVFEAGNTGSYAQAIIRLADPVVRRRLAEAGRKAALEKYNWRTASNRLLATYQELAQAPNRRTPLRSLDLGGSVCKDGARLPR